MRRVVIVSLLLSSCIADRIPTRDDDARDGAIDQHPHDAATPVDLSVGQPADAAPADASTLDASTLDAAPLDALPIDAAPPVCALDFDSPAPAWPARGDLSRAGDFVWWRDGLDTAWIDVEGGLHRAEFSGGIPDIGDGWLILHRTRSLDRLDLHTGVVEQVGAQLRSIHTYPRWITWGGPDGLFAQGPTGAPRRVADCIRTCDAPIKTRDALWYLGRSRGQVEPALFRLPDDGGPHAVFEGPIRDLRASNGRETLWWWTINDPPQGDIGRPIVAAGERRVGYQTAPATAWPAWLPARDVVAFRDLDAGVYVVIRADGSQFFLETSDTTLFAADAHLVYRRFDQHEIVFFDPDAPANPIIIPGNTAYVVWDAPFAETVLRVERVVDGQRYTTGYLMGEAPRPIFDIEGAVSRLDWSPDARAVLVTTDRATVRESWLFDLESGESRAIGRRLDAADQGGWLDAERLMWLDEDGRLIVERIDQRARRVYGEGLSAVQRLGRGSDGCLRIVVGERTDRAPLEVRTRVMPDL